MREEPPGRGVPEEVVLVETEPDPRRKVRQALAFALGCAVLGLGAALLVPFFEPIAWASVLALFFFPVYRRLRSALKGHAGLSSLLMCVLIVAFIILPVFALLGSLTSEVIRVYTTVQDRIAAGEITIVPDRVEHPVLARYAERALEAVKAHEESVRSALVDLSRRAGEFFLRHGTQVAKNVAGLVFKAALMLVTLYYLFRDGEALLRAIKSLVPLPEREVENLALVASDVLYATLYGNILTAAIQGGLGVFILWAVGFSAPILWGIVMGLATFIPMFGTALVWLPATV